MIRNTIILLVAMVSFSGVLNAQVKKRPTAQEAAAKAKADADAKAKAAEESAKNKAADLQKNATDKLAAATAVDESKFNISVWGGYSFSMKSDYTKNVEGMFEGVSNITNKSNDSKLGGIAGAAEFYYGGNFQFGASVGYLKGHDITRKATNSGTEYTLNAKMDYTPIMGAVRYFIMPGLYAGAGLGIAPVTGGTETFKDPAGNYVQGGTPNVAWNLSYSGQAIIVQGRVGYDYALSNNVSIGIAGIFSYLQLELESFKQVTDSTTNTKLENISNSQLLITPALVITYKL
ncbi:hypothetical protein [Turneriella parva]|uniref:Outer membrane protein beta-barrel domain-containing protein n=1 Tax=Turneriella parva (strain ATCC BAA-1111 / DSM 21527 / NCTC 11395 / H) TaxID=869212 RepID=I4B3N4_TURPD|nr:hypothetical protein [Turneriella parva]AFM11891.1 hypothetical protein Turpa_1243 [Turneriella parva DSM 21527]